jgi:RNase adaptor protein for sRNA GlmZ degradation
MTENIPRCVEIGDSVIYQTLQDEVVILNMTDQQYYGLDNVGASMWKMLLDQRDIGAAADRLTAVYDVERKTVMNDLSALVRQLLDSGLLKASPSA